MGTGVTMDPQACVGAFGEPVGQVCERAMELGWNATAGAGWLASLAGVVAAFIFAAIVMVMAPQGEHRSGVFGDRVHLGDSLPVLIGAFLSLLVASMLLVLVSSQFHPLRVGLAISLATAVFAAGVVQTFVAIGWLFMVSPRTASAFGSVKLVIRFLMFASALLLHTTVWKSSRITTGEEWGLVTMVVSAALLAGPWLVARVVLGSRSMVERFNGRFQAFTTRCSVAFLTLAVVGMACVLNRESLTPATAYPDWLAGAILLGVGLLIALYEMNLPPLHEAPAVDEAGPAPVALAPAAA